MIAVRVVGLALAFSALAWIAAGLVYLGWELGKSATLSAGRDRRRSPPYGRVFACGALLTMLILAGALTPDDDEEREPLGPAGVAAMLAVGVVGTTAALSGARYEHKHPPKQKPRRRSFTDDMPHMGLM